MNTKTSPITKDVEKKGKLPDPGNLLLFIYTVVVALVILCGGRMQADGAEKPPEAAGDIRLEDIRQGELLVPGPGGAPTQALRLHGDFGACPPKRGALSGAVRQSLADPHHLLSV